MWRDGLPLRQISSSLDPEARQKAIQQLLAEERPQRSRMLRRIEQSEEADDCVQDLHIRLEHRQPGLRARLGQSLAPLNDLFEFCEIDLNGDREQRQRLACVHHPGNSW